MKSIYYAHSMKIYNTERESKEESRINSRFGNVNIVNPNDKGLSNFNFPQNCFDLIDKCPYFVFSTYQDCIGKGVFLEIRYAKNRDKDMFWFPEEGSGWIEPWDGSVTLNNVNDWKIRYGVVDNGN